MKNKYKLPIKNNPFLVFQVHFHKLTPFLYIQEHSKTSFLLPVPKFNRKSYACIYVVN